MNRDQLLALLKSLSLRAGAPGAHEAAGDEERAHVLADQALLEFINDREVTDAFEAIERWYA